jgi:hypothetical protein
VNNAPGNYPSQPDLSGKWLGYGDNEQGCLFLLHVNNTNSRKASIMNDIKKLLCKLLLISLLAIPLAGCDSPPWEQGMTLVVKIDTPKDGATVNASTVTVSGRVKGTESTGATLRINNTDAPVKDGKYSADITLTEGKNVILVAATGGQAKIEEKVTVTYVPAK